MTVKVMVELGTIVSGDMGTFLCRADYPITQGLPGQAVHARFRALQTCLQAPERVDIKGSASGNHIMRTLGSPTFRLRTPLRGLQTMFLMVWSSFGIVLAEELQVPEKFETIQSAIEASRDGDIISIAKGRYFESIDLKGKSIVVKSRGPEPAILDGDGVSGSLVNCTSGECGYVRFEGLHLKNGSGDSARYGSRAKVGGGLLLLNSSPSFINCRFESNDASYNGGAVYATNSNSTFQGCTFSTNSAEKGGGVFANRSTLSFTGCLFEQNNANFGGGAIFSDNRSTTTVSDCRFINNRASFNGGALYDYDSATTVSDSMFLNNVGAYKGGAAYHGWRSRGRIASGNDFRTPNDDIAGSGRSINQANPLGACFIGERCILATQKACLEGRGVWSGPDTRCEELEAPAQGAKRPSGDLNGDGRVDVRDMAILLGSWSRSSR